MDSVFPPTRESREQSFKIVEVKSAVMTNIAIATGRAPTITHVSRRFPRAKVVRCSTPVKTDSIAWTVCAINSSSEPLETIVLKTIHFASPVRFAVAGAAKPSAKKAHLAQTIRNAPTNICVEKWVYASRLEP